MKQQRISSTKLAWIAVVESLLLAFISPALSIAFGLSGLAGVNAENRDKVPVYRIPYEVLHTLQYVGLVVALVSVVVAIVALVNLRYKNLRVWRGVVAVSLLTVVWWAFISWAAVIKYVPAADAPSTAAPSGLQAHTINIE